MISHLHINTISHSAIKKIMSLNPEMVNIWFKMYVLCSASLVNYPKEQTNSFEGICSCEKNWSFKSKTGVWWDNNSCTFEYLCRLQNDLMGWRQSYQNNIYWNRIYFKYLYLEITAVLPNMQCISSFGHHALTCEVDICVTVFCFVYDIFIFWIFFTILFLLKVSNFDFFF